MSDRFKRSEENILDKFNNDCLEFINYIKQCTLNEDIYVLYMLRKGNEIYYGRYNQGERINIGVILMVSDDGLKKLYELIQKEFSSSFVDGCKHTFGGGWSLIPTIGENIMIDIDSSDYEDKNWMYEESHKEQMKYLSKVLK